MKTAIRITPGHGSGHIVEVLTAQVEADRRANIRANVERYYRGFEAQLAERPAATERADLLIESALEEVIGRGMDSPRSRKVARYLLKAREALNGRD